MGDHPEREIVHRDLDTDGENPATAIATVVADLEDVEPTALATMYGCIDGVLDHLFSDPPAPEAQLSIEFSYEGYRIKVEQDGTATFVKIG